MAIVVQAWFLQVRLARVDDQLAFRHLTRDLLRILDGSVVMGALVWLGVRGLARWLPPGRFADLLTLALLVPGGAGVYAGILWVLRIEGRDEIAALAGRIPGRLGLRSGG